MVFLLFPVVCLSSCTPRVQSNGGPPAGPTRTGTLSVAAASDLKGTLEEIVGRFEKRNAIKVTVTYGSSGQLATQIEKGAPYDVFASASESYVRRLENGSLIIPQTKQVYAIGKIGVWSKPGLRETILSLDDLKQRQFEHLTIANPAVSPYGQIAKQALEKAGLWKKLESRIVYTENVRGVLQTIKTGNTDIAIVPMSFAKELAAPLLPVEENLYTPLQQTVTSLAHTKNEVGAFRFGDTLAGQSSKPILKAHGFDVP